MRDRMVETHPTDVAIPGWDRIWGPRDGLMRAFFGVGKFFRPSTVVVWG